MTPAEFAREIARLKTEWPNSYGEAKSLALWDAFRAEKADVFAQAITDILFGHKGYSPTGKDIQAALTNVKTMRAWAEQSKREADAAERARAQVEKQAADEPRRVVEPEDPRTPAEREADKQKLLAELYAKLSGPPPPPKKDEMDRQDELRHQLHIVRDWKSKQAGDHDD